MALLDHQLAIDQHIVDPGRIGGGILVGRDVLESLLVGCGKPISAAARVAAAIER
jgi:hypothetical protein